jgi:hypothetical protein
LSVRAGSPEHEKAKVIADKLEDYPVVDEDDFSELEDETAEQVWRDCYSDRDRDRVEYIRGHENQFDFHNYADLLGCARGKYFSGYAGELLH